MWFLRFVGHVLTLNFAQSRTDTSLFVLCQGTNNTYLLLYIDDMILSASSVALLQQIIGHLKVEFAIKDMGSLQFFLGIDVQRRGDRFFLS